MQANMPSACALVAAIAFLQGALAQGDLNVVHWGDLHGRYVLDRFPMQNARAIAPIPSLKLAHHTVCCLSSLFGSCVSFLLTFQCCPVAGSALQQMRLPRLAHYQRQPYHFHEVSKHTEMSSIGRFDGQDVRSAAGAAVSLEQSLL